ncbi:xanthine dehydrogenase family protein molybdopterin-binding subunit [Mesorhizobium sp. M1C.F.Ca.ET.193.01.1.1]|uniref:xanthine dehydrogenase family protein molybdopterin-binding subunit n=1 Tax=unclassified Mesorhizobium TaxID=325217 RepID=UPI000FD62166|nr:MULTISPECIES: xanthine dehydrogenase family protein molybdopterin-binding subunit [unclassified Mesorhizobium]TGS91193.1 xanthine dehydrogenase family protein molybdopterin-binding subunit [bacterium M00.F.Ca.ET.177.01.1.1]TGQ49682.1 xanthine dehydrogenase family protein molybdopterin-binding subunit [Mesorhizobium sp. M1C.F.Ca.ET.210.01.1.1]TGQ63919.1 xanthine dehydrogenase family protein molybdopterin-binding subunit [Mesorhizobium sp. M1C.F.Ca.ET.212.01.1.1]TGQ97553.1 xanthine dehydrogena
MNFDPRYSGRSFTSVGTRPIRPDGVDKVTGRARYGADFNMAGQLVGRILRSPHAHAIIRKIDTSKAEKLAGVKAVITAKDLPDLTDGDAAMYDILDNSMARTKALYDGHAVAAVAAIDARTARQALKLIEVDYEVLPHVTDVDEAMKHSAPLINDAIFTEGLEEKPVKPSNVTKRTQYGHGDVHQGFGEADFVVERSFKTEQTHQGYIEPHACVASVNPDGTADLWVCTQGHFVYRQHCAQLLGLEASKLRVTSSEIGGGFGGKTHVWAEPVALALSRKAGRPVKLVMTRDEVFRASGPTSATSIDVKIGAKKDGTITAAEATLRYSCGPYAGMWAEIGAMTAFACYKLENVKTVGYEVLVNRPKTAAYRAPSAPMAAFAVESAVDELAKEIGIDPVDFRIKNAAQEGTRASYGPVYGPIGIGPTLEAVKNHPHMKAPLGTNQGRGMACGFWFNFGGQTCTDLNIGMDGSVSLAVGTVDVGGSRASLSLVAAEELGIDYAHVKAIVADTSSLGYNDMTDGSRGTFSSSMATISAARNAIKILRERAAQMWDISVDDVAWEKGHAVAKGEKHGNLGKLSLKEIAAESGKTGGPIAGHSELVADGAGVSFATHICDIEVDPETGSTRVLRYTVVQDAGKAVHPTYVEGQYQGGAAQGIGWALNEEYIYGKDGRLQNPGFLDYRIPVCSDLPMIDTQILEIPNPNHPYGVRGVGETSIVPPLAAIANAVSNAVGVRMSHIPMSPPRILAALEAERERFSR